MSVDSTGCGQCRQAGEKLFLKGARCRTSKCAFDKRGLTPGQHGKKAGTRKFSEYGKQLREKQKARRIYGIGEHQFRLYFKKAEKAKGITGSILLQFLERRLDNVIFSLGFATSRAEGRQIVKHRFVIINSRPVNVPSYLVKPKDIVSIKSDPKKVKRIRENIKLTKERTLPTWLSVNQEKLQGEVIKLPVREDIQFPIQEQMIVELYSK